MRGLEGKASAVERKRKRVGTSMMEEDRCVEMKLKGVDL
jgi:hypothetical protein